MFLSILTFEFYPICRSFLGFYGPKKLFWRLPLGSKFVLGCLRRVQHLLFSMFPLIMTFDFVLISELFWLFGAIMCYFFCWGNFQKLFLGLLIKLKKLIFCASFNYNPCFFWPNSGVVLGLLGPKWAIFGTQGTVQKLFWDVLT